MTSSASTAGWRDLQRGAPEIARLGMVRLAAARVAMLGTLRPDGSPRISPVEPHIVNGHLLVGAMTWSKKAHDLLRDPRYVLHSVVSGPDNGEAELKLHGSAVPAAPGLRDAATAAWWSAQEPGQAVVFSLRIATALYVEWDLEHGLMTIHRWSPRDGYSATTRGYPKPAAKPTRSRSRREVPPAVHAVEQIGPRPVKGRGRGR
ncbi:MAG TPA: pyridoxamine 5'-phosphate oxidase family protein [Streptosporangiaceae bacterium]|nr:pyridoxamine 5'-phosphate oxidase family protein [Streptosporangiaceae bacterium]